MPKLTFLNGIICKEIMLQGTTVAPWQLLTPQQIISGLFTQVGVSLWLQRVKISFPFYNTKLILPKAF